MVAKKKSPKSSVSKSAGVVAQIGTQPNHSPESVQFPYLSPKQHLLPTTTEPDQIILIPDLFSEEECKRYIKFIEELPLELTPPPKRGEAERVNHRISITSPTFAKALFEILEPHLPDFPYPASLKKPSSPARRSHSLNTNIRLYKYTPGQHFGVHYDDSVKDPITGARSEWTLLIYLSGLEDGVVGGETIFYKGQGKKKSEIKAPLHRGMALLHRHGHECLPHEGSEVTKGVKYILRSDIMFMD